MRAPSANPKSRNNFAPLTLFAAAFACLVGASCQQAIVIREPASAVVPPIAYNPFIPSRTFTSAGTVTGAAYYQYRLNGFGEIQDGGARYVPTTWAAGTTYAFNVNGNAYSFVSSSTVRSVTLGSIAAIVNAGTFSPKLKAVVTTADVRITPVDPVTASSFAAISGGTIVAHAAPNPIRFAEVRVYDSSGTLVQGAETTSTGSFSFTLPLGAETYSVEVTARSANSSANIYVMKDPTSNTYWSIQKAGVTASGTSSSVILVAPGDGSLEGGAFNILDQMIKSNEFLRTQTANCASSGDPFYFPNCANPFTVNPLLYVYWAPGVNPGRYFGSSNPVSFYLLGRKQLYLLSESTSNSADNDHFDSSVIVHEYGHFLEDVYAKPDSPGVSHDGWSIIDPRLAWGEGWADFFQAAVTGSPFYRDSRGNVDCVTLDGGSGCAGYAINFAYETTAPGRNDAPSLNGEGNFREFSIARVLWRVLDKATYFPSGPTTHSTAKFSELWTILTSTSVGFAKSVNRFRSVGLFHKIQQSLPGATDWSAIRASELHRGDLTDYATPLAFGSGCTSSTITMTRGSDASFALADSNQFSNNDFYDYAHPGGTANFQLRCLTNCTANDLDLYIWKSDYTFAESASLVLVSAVANNGTAFETTSGTLGAGHYMVNVNIDTFTTQGTSNGTQSIYELYVNGQRVCPSP